MSTLHPVTSSLANSRIQYRQSLRLDSSFTSAVLIKTRTNVCHGITAHTLWGFHGEHQVNTEKLLSCTRATNEGIAVLEVWSIFPFAIKRILGIKRISSCSFENKRMRLLTRVYGTQQNAVQDLPGTA